ncbi:hypothetical protein [Alicyclobacillus acidocaldarius]|uniref:Uncharacterized protein n=1 Tax=Alicyclobacillus acidocaldarius (strain Tc-4-1) TaxID=1048834 RepID=F8IGJ4_ALIAT|nr:hypothetical protein [Alicyclobacillus acidocaldarius]AEJ44274.1 hypothetical protein TC41_2374 [Alicyclobacillus acidocaldarius subsp. acidocaldarius Tc-4-1]
MTLRELTLVEIDALWHAADKSGYPPEVVQSAYASMICGVGLRNNESTCLATGTGRRPNVCPFRWPRFRYGLPERLIETTIPWLLQFTARLHQQHLEYLERKRT